MSNSGGSSKDFPVGDANDYELVNVRSTSTGSATGHIVIVRCIPGNANNGSSTFANGIDKVSAVRYYKISYATIGAGAGGMVFDRFRPSYNYSDGISTGNDDLRVAYSFDTLDNRATWTAFNQTFPHSSSLTTVPRTITPDADSLLPGLMSLWNGGKSVFLAVARNTGTTANSLELSVVIEASTNSSL